MNWITGIQRAINYIEDHVEDDIDIAAAAREAASPPFHFQRMFSMLTGITLGDYIRMRRLSLAADELRRGNEKTIDIALRFGYDTPESFSRAFQRFHGITPTEARHGGNVRSFSRLSVKLTLYGGNLMDYRIEKRDAFSIICKRKHVNKPEGTSAEADIAPPSGRNAAQTVLSQNFRNTQTTTPCTAFSASAFRTRRTIRAFPTASARSTTVFR